MYKESRFASTKTHDGTKNDRVIPRELLPDNASDVIRATRVAMTTSSMVSRSIPKKEVAECDGRFQHLPRHEFSYLPDDHFVCLQGKIRCPTDSLRQSPNIPTSKQGKARDQARASLGACLRA